MVSDTTMVSDTVPIVSIRDLSVVFGEAPAAIRAVDGVSLDVFEHDIYAVVGESGCGKSTLAYSLLNLVPQPGRITAGQVLLDGRSLRTIGVAELNRLRAVQIAIVFQAAMNAFNPVLTIGRQVEHILAAHPGVFESTAAGRRHFTELLQMVRLPADKVWRSFESQLSGGMKQRVAIAVALLLQPRVLVLDEPTTALDVLNQRLVIDILKELQRTLGLTIIFVTHDLAVVAELASKVAVMYAGRLVDEGSVQDMFSGKRRHPYVAALIDAIPSVARNSATARPIPGQVPNLGDLPAGCRFAPRCALVQPRCRDIEPALIGARHRIACHVVNDDIPANEGVRP